MKFLMVDNSCLSLPAAIGAALSMGRGGKVYEKHTAGRMIIIHSSPAGSAEPWPVAGKPYLCGKSRNNEKNCDGISAGSLCREHDGVRV